MVVHTQAKNLKCNFCNAKFRTVRLHKFHQRNHVRYICKTCNKEFSSESRLQVFWFVYFSIFFLLFDFLPIFRSFFWFSVFAYFSIFAKFVEIFRLKLLLKLTIKRDMSAFIMSAVCAYSAVRSAIIISTLLHRISATWKDIMVKTILFFFFWNVMYIKANKSLKNRVCRSWCRYGYESSNNARTRWQ